MYKENITEAEYEVALESLYAFAAAHTNSTTIEELSFVMSPVGRALRTITLARGVIQAWGGADCRYLGMDYTGNLFVLEQESGADQQDWIAVCSGDENILVRKWVKRNLLKAREDKYSLPIVEAEYRFQLPSAISINSAVEEGSILVYAQDQEEPYPRSKFIAEFDPDLPPENRIIIIRDEPDKLHHFAQIVQRGVADLLPHF